MEKASYHKLLLCFFEAGISHSRHRWRSDIVTYSVHYRDQKVLQLLYALKFYLRYLKLVSVYFLQVYVMKPYKTDIDLY